MTVLALTQCRRLPSGEVYIAWTTGDFGPPYRVFVNGVQVATTRATRMLKLIALDESAIIEVLDDPSASPSIVRSARLNLGWAQSSGADHYRVERKIDSVWTEIDRVKDTGAATYSYRTPPLADDTVHELRVVPQGTNGLDGTALTFNALEMIRHPDVPDVAFAFNDTAGTVTITAA